MILDLSDKRWRRPKFSRLWVRRLEGWNSRAAWIMAQAIIDHNRMLYELYETGNWLRAQRLDWAIWPVDYLRRDVKRGEYLNFALSPRLDDFVKAVSSLKGSLAEFMLWLDLRGLKGQIQTKLDSIDLACLLITAYVTKLVFSIVDADLATRAGYGLGPACFDNLMRLIEGSDVFDCLLDSDFFEALDWLCEWYKRDHCTTGIWHIVSSAHNAPLHGNDYATPISRNSDRIYMDTYNRVWLALNSKSGL